MKNQLIDLNNHLFAQIERLGDESLKKDALKQEIERSKAIAGISKEIISNARLALDAEIARQDYQGKLGNLVGLEGKNAL